MSDNRLPDYLDHIQAAAMNARDFVSGMEKDDFLRDIRTQQAVIMSLVIIGEASAKVMDTYPDFVLTYHQIPWHNMRGMRNRIAHGYFEIDLELV